MEKIYRIAKLKFTPTVSEETHESDGGLACETGFGIFYAYPTYWALEDTANGYSDDTQDLCSSIEEAKTKCQELFNSYMLAGLEEVDTLERVKSACQSVGMSSSSHGETSLARQLLSIINGETNA